TPSRSPEGHGAEGERADDQAGVSKSAVGSKAHRFFFKSVIKKCLVCVNQAHDAKRGRRSDVFNT
ncbi:hypothetical protein, partial [Nostoc sp.]